ncbi:uncharacterized protein LOC109847708 [Asparagus officinalis]|uniref:uncharacterized protein LOC109847708 n=1 Tax=Asparagus officinalis TaxID=4686 RepID=UPI00098E2811|nr:uncharacterized protein LOC109847708 [Asparagus officinalis]
MSFGVTNALSTFMNLMNLVFYDVLDKFVEVFIDDILVYSKSEAEHVEHLQYVLKTLRQHRLFAKYSKCQFWLDRVAFLGHVVSGDGISLDPEKVFVVKDWPIPKSVSDIKSFLGLAGYYRHFIRDFLKISEPMTQLTRKDIKFIWSDACEKVFEELKSRLITTPVLTIPDKSGNFEVFCDASGRGLGCVLQ